MSRINFCQYLLETPATASIETYDRLIMQVNYSTSDVEKALRDQEPDEIIVVVQEPFGCVMHCVVPYKDEAVSDGDGYVKEAEARGVLYFKANKG
jgi:hypothetical protein